MISTELNKSNFKDYDDFFECAKLNLIEMILKKRFRTIECFIEFEENDCFLGDFKDLGSTALSNILVVYADSKDSEDTDIFYFRYRDLEYILISKNNKNNILKVKIKFKKAIITFRYKYVDYKEYIKSEEWKVKRKEVLERDKFKCRLCGAKGTEYNLHVHHNSYDNLGNEPLEDLITLCKKCHETYHKS